METTVKERLTEFIKVMGVSTREFERNCGLSNGYVKGLRKSPTTDMMQKILHAYPTLNQVWLISGDGEMLNTTTAISTKQSGLYYDIPATCGQVEQYPDILRHQSSGTIDIPQTKGAEFFLPVMGMSMKPTIEEGEVIGVTHINIYETTNADRIYLIITRDNERMIKRILHYDQTEGTLLLGSDNPNYPPFSLRTELVVDIYKVVCHIKVETL